MKRDKENEMLRSTGENEEKHGVSPDFSVVGIIFSLSVDATGVRLDFSGMERAAVNDLAWRVLA